MMSAVLSNPNHPEYGVATIPFPIPHDQYTYCMELLKALEIGDAVKADCKVVAVDSFFSVLKRTEMLTVNVEELNYLAKRLESFDTGEAAQFQAMAHKLELFELKDLINLTFCCQQATVITDFSDLAAIGRDHYMNLHGGSASVDEMNKLDGKGTARQLIENGGGTITPYPKISTKEENSMKFNLNHDPNNKTLSIPRAALQLSGLAGVSDLILHTDSGCILLLPGDPTVAELLKTISLISAVAPQLISRLAERSQLAMETGMAETACGACEHEPHCSGLEIPPCQLAEAGISPNAALESFVEEGRVIVQAAEKTAADVLIDELDDDVRTMLEDSGVQMEGVCRLLEKEEVSG